MGTMKIKVSFPLAREIDHLALPKSNLLEIKKNLLIPLLIRIRKNINHQLGQY